MIPIIKSVFLVLVGVGKAGGVRSMIDGLPPGAAENSALFRSSKSPWMLAHDDGSTLLACDILG
jgi:hypothetical protein